MVEGGGGATDAFCTVADLAAFLQIEIPAAKQASAQRAIDAVTAEIRSYCRQYISLVEDDEVCLDVEEGCTKLFLPETPVISVAAVSEETNGELVEGDDYKLGRYGVLHRIGAEWEAGVQTVTVTYTHGRDPLPDDLVDICVRAAARAYQAGLRVEAQEGVSVQAESLGDHSVTYGAEAGGEAMVLGASGAPILLKSERAALRDYRL